MAMRSVSDRANPVVVNGLRCVIASFVLGSLVVATGRLGSLLALPSGVVVAIVASGVLGQAIGDAAFVRSAKLIGASRALPLSGISPLLTLGLALALLGEPVTLLAAFGALLVMAGVFLLAFPVGPLHHLRHLAATADRGGVVMAFAAACCYTASTLILRQGLMGMDVDLVAANLVRMLTAAVLLSGVELGHSGFHRPAGLGRRALIVMLLAGTLSAFSSSMYLASVYYAGAAKAAVLTSTSPLFGLPLSLVFLKERFNARVLQGTVLSVVGIWLVLWR
mgnify:CR=1 FL=1